jgi:hypothetical protein
LNLLSKRRKLSKCLLLTWGWGGNTWGKVGVCGMVVGGGGLAPREEPCVF